MSIWLSLIIIILDQVNKYLVHSKIKGTNGINAVDNFLRIVYVENSGAAFGILKDSKILFIVVTLVIIGFISLFATLNGIKNKTFDISVALIIGGGIGNLIDRLFFGYVIDYIKLSFFPPVCNISDYAVFFGTILLLTYIMFIYDGKPIKPLIYRGR